tara:strand:- start:171 stop:533 length:363 start_codon:yes stop_codon:yes gene_type:complete
MSPVGVTITKKTSPIIIGEKKVLNKIPSLYQSLLTGVKYLEFIEPKTKKIKEIKINQILISLLLISGQMPIRKNTIKKVIPKLLFEPILIFDIFLLSLLLVSPGGLEPPTHSLKGNCSTS